MRRDNAMKIELRAVGLSFLENLEKRIEFKEKASTDN
jgi:hypothetical protein